MRELHPSQKDLLRLPTSSKKRTAIRGSTSCSKASCRTLSSRSEHLAATKTRSKAAGTFRRWKIFPNPGSKSMPSNMGSRRQGSRSAGTRHARVASRPNQLCRVVPRWRFGDTGRIQPRYTRDRDRRDMVPRFHQRRESASCLGTHFGRDRGRDRDRDRH
jgi:hypothetical protein